LPVTYDIDAGRRLVTTTVWGAANEEEIHEHGRQLRADPCFDPQYRQLADMSGVTEICVSSPTLEQLSRGQLFAPGTKRAFVAGSDGVFGMLRKYELHAESVGQVVRVFRDRKTAERWLESEEN
jgi:hypothetical protein